MVEEVWTPEVLDGEGASKIIANEPIFLELDAAKQAARQRMASIVEHDQPGDVVRLCKQGGELYRWSRDDHALATARAKEIEERRPGKR